MTPLSVKFCGFTNLSDLQAAYRLGVSAIGLVYYPPSPRYVDIDTAKHLAMSAPAFVSVVALVVNIDKASLMDFVNHVPFDILQFHGDETAEHCADLAKLANKRWIKAIRVQETMTADDVLVHIQTLAKHGASGVILDAYHPDKFGGTGECFDWSKIPENSPLPIYLAGGLTPENITTITSNPALLSRICGVDVSGGIEKEKGVKCGERMREFMGKLRR